MQAIDKKQLLNELQREIAENGEFYALRTVKSMPSVDAEPVLRCKECKYGMPGAWGIHCDYWNIENLRDLDFCSRGRT